MNITHPSPANFTDMKPTHTHLRGAIIVGCSLLALAAYFKLADRRPDDLVIPNEKAVALAKLAEKFTGPGYFHQGPDDPRPLVVTGQGDIYITATNAWAQEARVVHERHLNPEAAAKVHRLIEWLTEPPPSRFSTERVNMVRLNLALDELK